MSTLRCKIDLSTFYQLALLGKQKIRWVGNHRKATWKAVFRETNGKSVQNSLAKMFLECSQTLCWFFCTPRKAIGLFLFTSFDDLYIGPIIAKQQNKPQRPLETKQAICIFYVFFYVKKKKKYIFLGCFFFFLRFSNFF